MLNHRLVKRGRKTRVECHLTFVGYGPEHNFWQDDVEKCEHPVQDSWASKPEPERFVLILFPPIASRAHGRHQHGIICLCPPMMHAELQAAVQLDTGLYVVKRKALCNRSECVHAFRERPSQAFASSS